LRLGKPNTSAYRIFIHVTPARKRSGIVKVTLWIIKAMVLRRGQGCTFG